MNAVLDGTPKENLPDKALIQGDTGKGVAEPTTEAPPSSEAPASTSSAAPSTTAPDPATEDTDGDGVPDVKDPKPNDRTITGNPATDDTDGDGVPDAEDPKPNDPTVSGRNDQPPAGGQPADPFNPVPNGG
jgi:hypothetical protein